MAHLIRSSSACVTICVHGLSAGLTGQTEIPSEEQSMIINRDMTVWQREIEFLSCFKSKKKQVFVDVYSALIFL